MRFERQATLEHLSLEAKLELKTIKKIELGRANPSLKEITKLATASAVPLHELLSTKKIDMIPTVLLTHMEHMEAHIHQTVSIIHMVQAVPTTQKAQQTHMVKV
jgi:transcriptional regulator with XRE-family HTH domain